MIDNPTISANPARVLLVDDEQHNRQLLELMLAPENLQLQTACTGEEALAMVALLPPDLIVLDIMMPGMDGYQVVEQLKGNPTTKCIPIVIVTALDDRTARLRGLNAGAEDFLSKPVDRLELCARVKNLVQRKRAEEELGQGRDDQIRIKDEFLSHVSHELRSPLTAIKQFTTILLGGLAGDLNEEQHQYQEIVLRNVNQLHAMIDDLLELTRLEAGKLTVEPTCTSVVTTVQHAFDTLRGAADSKQISLTHEIPEALPTAFADQTRLQQLLIILLDNSITFTPEGGAVHIRVQVKPDDARYLLVEVSDTGCGISPELVDKVFGRLYQTATSSDTPRKGLGLGLYICKELVIRQGGEIWIAPQTGPGTTVSLTLPVFSLGDLLVPLLREGGWPADSIALVTVDECWPAALPPINSRERTPLVTGSFLARCLLPDLDVLLPSVKHGLSGEQFFITAFADAAGAAVLCNRIRGQVARHDPDHGDGSNVSVSYQMLEYQRSTPAQSRDAVVSQLAGVIEAAIARTPFPVVGLT